MDPVDTDPVDPAPDLDPDPQHWPAGVDWERCGRTLKAAPVSTRNRCLLSSTCKKNHVAAESLQFPSTGLVAIKPIPSSAAESLEAVERSDVVRQLVLFERK